MYRRHGNHGRIQQYFHLTTTTSMDMGQSTPHTYAIRHNTTRPPTPPGYMGLQHQQITHLQQHSEANQNTRRMGHIPSTSTIHTGHQCTTHPGTPRHSHKYHKNTTSHTHQRQRPDNALEKDRMHRSHTGR